jgi:CysZ protein
MSGLRSFRLGMGHALGGLRYVYRDHPALARIYVWPILIMGSALYFAVRFVLQNYESWGESLWAVPVGDGFWIWLAGMIHVLFEWAILGVALAAALLVAALGSSVVAAPFNDALSEAVEELETGRSGPPFSLGGLVREVARTIRVETGKLAIYLAVMGPLFVLSYLVPGLGQVLYTLFGVFFTMTYFAVDYVDWPASRRGLGLRDRVAFLRSHQASMLGFGAGVWVLLIVPIVNLFFMPAAVAGGTRLFLELEVNRAGGPLVGAGASAPELPDHVD